MYYLINLKYKHFKVPRSIESVPHHIFFCLFVDVVRCGKCGEALRCKLCILTLETVSMETAPYFLLGLNVRAHTLTNLSILQSLKKKKNQNSKTYFLHFWRLGNPRSRCRQIWLLLKVSQLAEQSTLVSLFSQGHESHDGVLSSRLPLA